MEKQQVSTFLKILQIPSNADPEEIKRSLLESGWNEKDADEAVAVLYPGYQEGSDSAPVQPKESSQIVAQKYVKPAGASQESSQETPSFTPHAVESADELATAPDTAPTSTPEPAPESAPTPPSAQPAEQSPIPPAAPPADATPLPEKAPIPTNIDAAAEKDRPHTDAPWLQQQVDIYDVSEEEKERMIRTVYRTNERLSPQTIHALLGIDVDLSEYEAAYESRRDEAVNWVSILIIILSSLAIASVGLFLGLYYFEVGPFHPTVTNT